MKFSIGHEIFTVSRPTWCRYHRLLPAFSLPLCV